MPASAILIGPVELFAVVAARRLWGSYLDSSRALFFVDHSGVHAACVSGTSRDTVWRSLLVEFERADAVPMIGWIARVPSASNPSDAPSRGSSNFPFWGTCSRDHPSCCMSGELLSPLELKRDV